MCWRSSTDEVLYASTLGWANLLTSQWYYVRYLMSTLRKSPECTGASLSLTMLILTSNISAAQTTATNTNVAIPATAFCRHLQTAHTPHIHQTLMLH
jgi:hypothetical protein